MKVNRNVKLLLSIVLLGFYTPVHAFSGRTHKALTENAILGSGCEIANTS